MKKYLFIDRDGTLVYEPEDYQVDALHKIKFLPRVIPALLKLQYHGFTLVMVSNQDGLGTESFPLDTFSPAHEFILNTLESQGINFEQVLICPHKPEDNCACRKPKLGLVQSYLNDKTWDRAHSYFIGDRDTDLQMAQNMGITGLRVGDSSDLDDEDGASLLEDSNITSPDSPFAHIKALNWDEIATKICIELDYDLQQERKQRQIQAEAAEALANREATAAKVTASGVMTGDATQAVDEIAAAAGIEDMGEAAAVVTEGTTATNTIATCHHCSRPELEPKGTKFAPSTHRVAVVERNTRETQISLRVDLDTVGGSSIHTGIGFFNHMLDQIATHAGFSLQVMVLGDLEVDGHHTIEDTAIALGTAIREALGDKRGIGRFGFVLPMDEVMAEVFATPNLDLCELSVQGKPEGATADSADDKTITVALDISGRPHVEFDFHADFTREDINGFDTQMVPHFFESLAVALGLTLHMKVTTGNAHHQVEALFKAFGRALRPAIKVVSTELPSSKGTL